MQIQSHPTRHTAPRPPRPLHTSSSGPSAPSALPYEQLRALVHACHTRLGRPLTETDLDDAVQSTAIAAWHRRHSYASRSAVETWVYGIARLEILDAVRKQQRVRSRHVALECGTGVADAEALGSTLGDGTRRRVLRILGELGTTAALILRLRLVEDERFEHIAERVHMSEAATKARFHRLLPRARARLGSVWRSISGS